MPSQSGSLGASLIVQGYKHYEFRTWRTHYRGRFFIHAGQQVEQAALSRFSAYPLTLAPGAIVGEAMLTDCVEVTPALKQQLLEQDPQVYRDSCGFAFVLAQVQRYAVPIPCKGRLGFWLPPQELALPPASL